MGESRACLRVKPAVNVTEMGERRTGKGRKANKVSDLQRDGSTTQSAELCVSQNNRRSRLACRNKSFYVEK